MTGIQAWIEENIPDQTGKLALITGANSGIGFHAARFLAARGARILMACRSPDKGQQAVSAILADNPVVAPELIRLDLADLASIHSCASKLSASYPRLDILINNAGVMALPRRQTKDGFEMQFGINHLGHFALTGLLLNSLLSAPAARVVTVSSSMHLFGKMNFDDLNAEKRYQKWSAYGQSKLANLLFAYEIQRRLARNGFSTISLGCHPGFASTNLQIAGPRMEGSQVKVLFNKVVNRLFAQSAQMGALPVLYAAVSSQLSGSEYIGPGSFGGYRGYPKKVKSSAASHDVEVAAQLWTVSEELTGVHYERL